MRLDDGGAGGVRGTFVVFPGFLMSAAVADLLS
jgi:hypothetical protein